jgi:hypothetical protein
MEPIIRYWSNSNFTNLTSTLIAIIGLFYSIINTGRFRNSTLIPFFFAGYIITNFVSLFDSATYPDFRPFTLVLKHSIELFDTSLEFYIFYQIIKDEIINVKIKRWTGFVLTLYFALVLTVLIFQFSQAHFLKQITLQTVFTLEAVCLIILCIFYFVDLLSNFSSPKLISEPSFWIITGISFFMVCTLPFSIISNYLINSDYKLYIQLFSIFDVFYCLLFLMIIRAYQCRPAITL